MKKHLIFTVILAVVFAMLAGSFALLAQVPQSFKYQAVIRDAAGAVMANQELNIEIIILKGGGFGEVVYDEQHTDTTNQFGLMTLDIGSGNVSTGDFSSIAWGDDTYFLMVEMDGISMGTTQLLSVPYAFHAQTVSEDKVDDADADPLNEIQSLSLSGNDLSLSKGGGSVTLPASAGGGDNWGTQTVVTDETLTGLGTETNPLGIVDGGVTSAKILDGSILTHDLADFNVTADKLANNSVTTEKINAGAVTGIKIAQAGATNGQALKWDGSTWAPADDLSGISHWQQSGSDIYFNTGKVGIGKIPGTDLRQFQVLTGNNQAIAGKNNSSNYAAIYAENDGTGPSAEFRNKIRIMDGSEGIGKVLTSDAGGYTSWQVPATVVKSSSGVIFSEIREITGNTSTGEYCTISYPSGYTMSNMRVLSLEVNLSGNVWVGLAGTYATNIIHKLFYVLTSTGVSIYYPNDESFHNRAFRMMIMKVE